jgi:hypothetical protein
MLSVINKSFKLSVIMLSVIMLSDVMLNVVVPHNEIQRNDFQHNDLQHHEKKMRYSALGNCDIRAERKISVMTEIKRYKIWSRPLVCVKKNCNCVGIVTLNANAKCHYAECHCTKCHGTLSKGSALISFNILANIRLVWKGQTR